MQHLLALALLLCAVHLSGLKPGLTADDAMTVGLSVPLLDSTNTPHLYRVQNASEKRDGGHHDRVPAVGLEGRVPSATGQAGLPGLKGVPGNIAR